MGVVLRDGGREGDVFGGVGTPIGGFRGRGNGGTTFRQVGKRRGFRWEPFRRDGKKCVAKELVEAIDKKNKLVRFKVIEGDLLNEFNSFIIIVQVIPKDQITAVMWTIEFEKKHDEGHYPTRVMDFCVEVTRDIEAHHLKA
uniref:Bet v I/Major latex protein domain-containing protein n=1 Tax=Chenopodium quinoa TaxID=63459 RepID=A0A803KTF6_CHEQI